MLSFGPLTPVCGTGIGRKIRRLPANTGRWTNIPECRRQSRHPWHRVQSPPIQIAGRHVSTCAKCSPLSRCRSCLGLQRARRSASARAISAGLSEAMQPVYADFALEIRAVQSGSKVTLHCVLRNVSVAKNAIEVDASTLPWRNADLFDINAVAANGEVVRRNPPPVQFARISGPPTPLTIASGTSIEGDIDLSAMPIRSLPRGEDLLLGQVQFEATS